MTRREWEARHRAFQDGYAHGFIRAFSVLRSAMDLHKELDYELIKQRFEKIMRAEGELPVEET